MSVNKKKVLVIAARFSGNLGDDVIYDVVADICETVRGTDPIGLSISGRDNYVETALSSEETNANNFKSTLKHNVLYKYYVEKKGAMCLKKKLRSIDIEAFDTVVFAGGQLFMDYFVPWINIIVRYAEKNNKKVIFNCCGIGELSSKSVQILKRVFQSKSVKAISVRDNLIKFQDEFHLHDVIQTADPALNCARVYSVKRKHIGTVGLGVISYRMLKKKNINISEDNYIQLLKKLVDWIMQSGKNVRIFTNGDEEDYKFASQFAKILPTEVAFERRPTRPIELVSIIASYDAVVSFRLHSLIVAASYNIPTIGFVWDEKVREFFEIINRDEYVFEISNDMDEGNVEACVKNLCLLDTYETNYSIPSSSDVLSELLYM